MAFMLAKKRFLNKAGTVGCGPGLLLVWPTRRGFYFLNGWGWESAHENSGSLYSFAGIHHDRPFPSPWLLSILQWQG